MGVMTPTINKLRGERANFAKNMMDKQGFAMKVTNGQVEVPNEMNDLVHQFAVDYISATILESLEEIVKNTIRNELGTLLIQIGNNINSKNKQQEIHKEEVSERVIKEVVKESTPEIVLPKQENNNVETDASLDKPVKLYRGSSLPQDKPYVVNRYIRWGSSVDENIAIIFDLLHTLEKQGVNIESQKEMKQVCTTVICNSKKLFGMSYGKLIATFKRKY